MGLKWAGRGVRAIFADACVTYLGADGLEVAQSGVGVGGIRLGLERVDGEVGAVVVGCMV